MASEVFLLSRGAELCGVRVRERVLLSAASSRTTWAFRARALPARAATLPGEWPKSASPRAGVALQRAPPRLHADGGRGSSAPRSLCVRRGKIRARAQRRRLPQMREARAEKTRRAAPSAPPLRPPSPELRGGGRKSRERGIGATLGPGKHVAENAAGRSPVGAGRRARPAAGAGPRGAARSRPSAPARPAARPSSPPRSLTPERRRRRRRRSRVCPAEGEGRRGGGGGLEVPLQRGLLCPCAEMTHGVPSRHARAQRTDTHKERGKYTAPARPPPPASRRGRPGQALRARPPLRPARPPPARGARTRRGPAPQSNNSRPR